MDELSTATKAFLYSALAVPGIYLLGSILVRLQFRVLKIIFKGINDEDDKSKIVND